MLQTLENREPLSTADRLRHLNSNFFIRYPAAVEIMDELEELADPYGSLRQDLCIVGYSGNGKSWLAKAFVRSFPVDSNLQGDAAVIPVVYVKTPGRASVPMLAERILVALGQTIKPGTKEKRFLPRAIAVLKQVKTKVLILDDIQHIQVGTATERAFMRNTLKELGELCDLSVIGFGTEAASAIVSHDTQIERRFELRALPNWKFDDHSRSLLVHVEKFMNLEHDSGIGFDEQLTRRIVADAEGTLGNMVKIIRLAAAVAIKSGEERITGKILDKIKWVPPSKRLAAAAKVLGHAPLVYG